MSKSFKWSGWVKPIQNGENSQMFVVYKGNFALDENGKPITRPDKELENCDDE